MIINGTGFLLRPYKPEDADSLVKHANNEKIASNLRDGFPHPYMKEHAVSWIKMAMENKKDLIFAVEVNGDACGGIGLHSGVDVYRYNAEIGYWLSEEYWGRGIITEAVDLLVEIGFTKYHWTRIYAGIFSNNPASMRVLEKCGFKHEATFRRSVLKRGKYLDEHVYSILKKEWKKGN